jgi:glucose/arabinose dehydrogenase
LLSVAFHPQYRANGFLFVNYTNKHGDTRIERYSASSADRNLADPASAKLILAIDQPYSNHNGRHNLFGPDGMLYIGMGDGGSQGDPHGNGQNRNVLLGKLLRINVDRGDPYVVPSGNPYAKGGGRGEIWATGLRNPWRFAFDRAAGMLYIADVGQDKYEEINVAPVSAAGVNYGWSTMDGPSCFKLPLCAKGGLQQPAYWYTHEHGTCSIIGGFVYRGRRIPEIQGQYLFRLLLKAGCGATRTRRRHEPVVAPMARRRARQHRFIGEDAEEAVHLQLEWTEFQNPSAGAAGQDNSLQRDDHDLQTATPPAPSFTETDGSFRDAFSVLSAIPCWVYSRRRDRI